MLCSPNGKEVPKVSIVFKLHPTLRDAVVCSKKTLLIIYNTNNTKNNGEIKKNGIFFFFQFILLLLFCNSLNKYSTNKPIVYEPIIIFSYSSTAIFIRRCHHSIPVRRNQRIVVPKKAGKAGRIQFYLFLQQ